MLYILFASDEAPKTDYYPLFVSQDSPRSHRICWYWTQIIFSTIAFTVTLLLHVQAIIRDNAKPIEGDEIDALLRTRIDQNNKHPICRKEMKPYFSKDFCLIKNKTRSLCSQKQLSEYMAYIDDELKRLGWFPGAY